MTRLMFFGVLLMVAQVSTPQCGESSSSPSPAGSSSSAPAPANNVATLTVNAGPTNNSLNQPFVSVTVCVPGTSNCQTIGGILVDTGSYGLRLLSSAVSIPLPQQNSGGSPVVECLPFIDGFTWGPVHSADVRIAGLQASSIPIQLVGVDRFPTIPSGCSSRGSSEQTQEDLQANGVLGVGPSSVDCGNGCTLTGSSNPGLYYTCPTPATCQVAAIPVANQVINPVARFPSDNNGVAIQLPIAPASGATSLTGALIFGIGTQANNQLGSAKVLTMDSRGQFTTTFNGQSYPKSFIDSGSNGIFFLDTSATGLPACALSKGFYCPTSTRPLSATQVGANGASATVGFAAGNVDRVNSTFSVFGEATGEHSGAFDWGLPFFYGRTVFTAIAGASTPGGNGPYWAW